MPLCSCFLASHWLISGLKLNFVLVKYLGLNTRKPLLKKVVFELTKEQLQDHAEERIKFGFIKGLKDSYFNTNFTTMPTIIF